MEEENEAVETMFFAVRTTAGQEKNAAELIGVKARSKDLPLISVLAPETLRGYIFIEARSPHLIEDAISGIRHVKSRVPGLVQLSEIEKYLITKPIIEELDVRYIVEITGGPFKGMRARITRLNKVRKEATLELLEATFTLPITVNVDYLKLIKKQGAVEEGSKEGAL
jgi:transcriptional antiterminator NusG